jgi:hypothetical protein
MLAQRATIGRGRFDPVERCAKRMKIRGRFDPVERCAKRMKIRGRFDPVERCAKRMKIRGRFDPVDSARSALKSQGAFADDHGGAADMRGHQPALIDFELHAHLSRPPHLAALAADEGR